MCFYMYLSAPYVLLNLLYLFLTYTRQGDYLLRTLELVIRRDIYVSDANTYDMHCASYNHPYPIHIQY
jgi:hypothetical protein